MRVLVVEDDRTLATFVERVLKEDGYAVDVAATGHEGQTLALTHDYDGIVLDLSLPDTNGVAILQRLRREGKATPVLIVSGRTETSDIVRALDAGADGYVNKPVNTDELRARVRALVRRGGPTRGEQIDFGDIVVNRLTRRALVNNVELRLTARELQLLEHLLLHAGEVVTRSDLLEKVWDVHFHPGSNVVDAHVSRLRTKLMRAGSNARITGVRGSGFVLTEA